MSEHRHPRARVWVLEDDADQLTLLGRRLRGCGWDVRLFMDSVGLLQALNESLPHVLILDRLLPQQNGLQLLERLRRNGYRFPVLVLSALGTATERVTGLETGADDYMAKPYLWRELQLRLERLLEQRNDLKPQRLTNQIFVLSGVRFDPARLLLSGPGGQICKITRGDAALLNLLCLSPGIVLERDQLLQATGSLVDANTSSTIAIRISKLRKLLHVCKPGSGNLLESVRGRGYRLNGMVQRESSV